MDRTLVHTASAVKVYSYILDSLGKWVCNIPFEAVPKPFIDQLRECPFTYEEFKTRCSKMDYWNLALLNNKDDILVIVWGGYDSLEKLMNVLRISARPDLFRFNGDLLDRVIDLLKKMAFSLGAEKIYWVTSQWEAYLRKLPGVVKLSNARIVEVY